MLKVQLIVILLLSFSLGCDSLKDKKQADVDQGDQPTDLVVSAVKLTGPSEILNDETCATMALVAKNTSDQTIPFANQMDVSFLDTTDGSTAVSFFSDSSCSTSLTDDKVTIPAETATQNVYFVVSDLVTATIPFGARTISATTSDFQIEPYTFSVLPNPAAKFTLFNISPSHNPFQKNTCYETYLNVLATNDRETVLNANANETLQFTASPSNAANLFLDANCTTLVTSAIIQAGSAWMGPVYFSISGANAENFVEITFITANSGVSGTATLPVNPN